MRQEAHMVLRGATPTHLTLRVRLVVLIVATLVIDAVGTALMYVLEHADRASGFHDVFGAFFWVSAQLTTVSSQLPNPVTTGGRLVDLALEAWSVSVVATLAASLASFFLARHHERTQAAVTAAQVAGS
jgi:hypothetical protein